MSLFAMFEQEDVDGKLQTLFFLFAHFNSYTTQEQFEKFLDCLEYSKNFTALRTFDPDRQVNTVPDSVEIPPMERTHICTFDVARILHDKSELPANWTILREALKYNHREWDQAVQMIYTHPLLDVIKFFFDTWSDHVGLDNSTVGHVCDSLDSHFPRNPRFLGRDPGKDLLISVQPFTQKNELKININTPFWF
jgi:hypothetical protein